MIHLKKRALQFKIGSPPEEEGAQLISILVPRILLPQLFNYSLVFA